MNTILLIAGLSILGLAAHVLAIKLMLDEARVEGFRAGFQAAQLGIDHKQGDGEESIDDEDVYVGADGDWLQDRLPRAWDSPRPLILGNAPSDVVLQQEVMPMNVVG
jgi:hypothetical protein